MSTRGRPFAPGNKLGRGRPKGSRNKISSEGWKILDQHHPQLIKKSILEAMKGDHRLLAALIKLVPQSERNPKLGILPMQTAGDLKQAHERVARKLGAGEISIDEAGMLDSFIEHRRKLIETTELADRIRNVEEKLKNDDTETAA